MLAAIVALYSAQRAQLAAGGEAKLALARAIAGQIQAALDGARNGVRAVAALPPMVDALAADDVERAAGMIGAVTDTTEFYRAFVLLDASHRPVAAHPVSEYALFETIMTSLDPLVVQRGEGDDAVMIVRHPVRDREGRALGAIAGAVSLERILASVERTRFGETGAASVLDRRAHVVVSSDPQRQDRRLAAPEIVELAASGTDGIRSYYAPTLGRHERSAVARVHGYPLVVLASQSEEEALRAITLFQRTLLAGLVLLTLGGGALFVYALRGYRAYERRIEASNALFSAVTEATGDLVFVKDRDGRYLFVNGALARFMGRAREDVLGRSDFEMFEPAVARRIRTADLSVIESGELLAGEYPMPDASGAEHLFSTVRAPYRGEGGATIGVISVGRDVTKEHADDLTIRRQAQELARANTLLNAVVEGTSDVVYVKDAEERYLLMNEAGATVFAAPRARIVGRRVDAFLPPAAAASIRARDAQVLAGETRTGEDVIAIGGVERTFLSVVTPWRDAAGRVVGLIGISRDISDRKRAEQTIAHQADELAQTNALLKGVVEGSPDAIFVKDLDGTYVMMNRVGGALFGKRPEELIGRTDADLFGETVAAYIASSDREVLEGGMPALLEERLPFPRGELMLQTAKAPLRDYEGRTTGLLGIARDVTEVDRARRALAESEKRYRDLFEMTTGLICVHALDGTLITVNPASATILGYSPEELAGRKLQELVPPEHSAKFAEYLRAFEHQEQQQGLLVLVARDGARHYLQFSNRLYGEPGAPRYVIGHANDITERRNYEQRLRDLTFSDPLTGLHNRRYLLHRESQAAAGARFGAIVIDLDQFKQINDTHGHQRGDEVLVAMGRFLQQHARRGDAVIRMGGDEFLVLLEDADEAVVASVSRAILEDAPNAPCGFSIGHSVREGDEPLEKTIDRADLSLYRVRVARRGYERRKH